MTSPPVLANRLEALLTAGNRLAADVPLPTVLQWIADTAREVIDARYAAVGMLGPDGRSLEHFVTSGMTPDERDRIGAPPVGRGILGLVIRSAEPVRLDDLGNHPDAVGFPPRHPKMTSFLGVPVIGRHGVFGNLYLTDKRGGVGFSSEDEHLATLLAQKAATAVEDARAFAESTRLLADVQSLLRSRERFFAMVNHELRNAVAAVLGWAEMLVRKKDPATVPRAAFEVMEAAESASALINDLLDLSRLDENRLRPVIEVVECGAVIRRAFARTTPAATHRGVHLEADLPHRALTCRTDGHRVEQILVNLLTNAIRHTREGSAVQVQVVEGDKAIRLLVSDEGPGVPVEHQDRIFDVYYSDPGDGQGVGLGLPLSRRLARLLSGDLSVANRPEGGAVFTLTLPHANPGS